ncbi:dihydrofolate reductase [Flavobacterium tegetincola]|uniref:dihydrofolate reductase n=1 Tax=Flavobacterium tegetincola TaxID=150172 RepID=UPI0004074889|nr:dihydrofolate reductase [Flavobacterium tegetincola]
MITLIAAAAENNALGKNNEMIWHLPDDFKRFKKLTSGHDIILGRKTFESFDKPLPNRRHIIVTRQENYAENIDPSCCIVVSSIEEAIAQTNAEEENFVIGGGEIYTLALPLADKIELTRVHGTFDADAYFPTFDVEKWHLDNEEYHSTDEKHKVDFTYQTFLKK